MYILLSREDCWLPQHTAIALIALTCIQCSFSCFYKHFSLWVRKWHIMLYNICIWQGCCEILQKKYPFISKVNNYKNLQLNDIMLWVKEIFCFEFVLAQSGACAQKADRDLSNVNCFLLIFICAKQLYLLLFSSLYRESGKGINPVRGSFLLPKQIGTHQTYMLGYQYFQYVSLTWVFHGWFIQEFWIWV